MHPLRFEMQKNMRKTDEKDQCFMIKWTTAYPRLIYFKPFIHFFNRKADNFTKMGVHLIVPLFPK